MKKKQNPNTFMQNLSTPTKMVWSSLKEVQYSVGKIAS